MAGTLCLQHKYIMTQHSCCCRDALQRFKEGMWADEEEGSPQADEEEGPPQAGEEEGSPHATDSPAASIEVDIRPDSSSPAPASTSCCPALRACAGSPGLRADGSSAKPAASPGLTTGAAADRAVPRSPDDDRVLQGRPFFVKLENSVKHACWYHIKPLLAQCP